MQKTTHSRTVYATRNQLRTHNRRLARRQVARIKTRTNLLGALSVLLGCGVVIFPALAMTETNPGSVFWGVSTVICFGLLCLAGSLCMHWENEVERLSKAYIL